MKGVTVLSKSKQFVTMPYSLYRDIRKRLEEERDRHIGRDKFMMRFNSDYDPKEESRDTIAARKINEILFDMDRQSVLEERL